MTRSITDRRCRASRPVRAGDSGRIMRAVGCLLALSLLLMDSGFATEEPVYALNLPGQSLSDALAQFATQSGLQVIFFTEVARGLRAPALAGSYTLTSAMHELLSASKLTFRVINARTVQIIAAAADSPTEATAGAGPATRRDHTRASHDEERDASLEEVVVNGTAEGLVATRTRTALREIPQTVVILTREQMNQQNDTTIGEALHHATGVTALRQDSLGETFYSRGFELESIHVDGGAALNSFLNPGIGVFLGVPDLSEFDHLEVLRGADALFGGDAEPGGTLNLVRKRAQPTFGLNVNATVGAWNRRRVEGDLTGPLNAAGSLRGRVDVMEDERDYFFADANLRRRNLFATLEYDLAPRTRLTLGGSYQMDDAKPFKGGLALYDGGRDSHLPRDTAFVFDWSGAHTRVHNLYLQVQQQFGSDWTLKLNAATWSRTASFADGYFNTQLDPVTQGLPVPPVALFQSTSRPEQQLTFDATVTGTLHWFGLREAIAFGGDTTQESAHYHALSYARFGAALPSVYAFDPADYPDPRRTSQAPTITYNVGRDNSASGAFASLRAYLNDDLSLITGARIGSDRSRAHLEYSLAGQTFTQELGVGSSQVVTPFIGILYDLDAHYSLYASYADVYRSHDIARRRDGSRLGITRGTDRELGIKGEWGGGRLNGSLVFYDIDQSNVLRLDNIGSSPVPVNPVGCCYVDADNRSRGADLELYGEIVPGWLVGTGYSYNETAAPGGSALPSQSPRHLLKVWSSRQLTGALDRWTLGGTVRAQSSTFEDAQYCLLGNPPGLCNRGLVDDRVTQSGYAAVDVSARLQIGPHLQASLNVTNVFDRRYYETVGTPLSGNWYGAPRGYTLRIDGRY